MQPTYNHFQVSLDVKRFDDPVDRLLALEYQDQVLGHLRVISSGPDVNYYVHLESAACVKSEGRVKTQRQKGAAAPVLHFAECGQLIKKLAWTPGK